MNLATLNSTYENESAIARSRYEMSVKGADPVSMLADAGYHGGGGDHGGEYEEDQYQHLRGRVYSAGRPIVQRLCQLPWHAARLRQRRRSSRTLSVMLRKGVLPEGLPEWLGDPDSLDMLPVHPVLSALANPNRLHTQFNACEMIGWSMIATGRGFLVGIKSDQPGRTIDLWPIPATWMRPSADRTQWIVKPPGVLDAGMPVDDAQVSYFYFADPSNMMRAISPLSMMARAVLVDEAIESAQHAEFRNGPVPKVALIAGDVMGETGFSDDGTAGNNPVALEPFQRRQIQTWFKQQYTQSMKHGLPIVLDAIIRDIKILSRKPAEMAFMESSNLTEDHIYRALGVSKVLVGEFENVNRASAAVVNEYFLDNVLNPLAMLISQAATKKLGPLFSTGNERIAVWCGPGVARDPILTLEKWKLGVRSYSVLRNDVRGYLGLERLEGYDDVIIPEKLEERLPAEDYVGVGRLAVEERDTDGSGSD